MKVTICGAQSVGKTTLVDSLPEKYQKYIIKKVIRNVILKSEDEIFVNEDSDAYSQVKFFDAYMSILSKKENYITDRGLLDVAAYTNYLGYKKKLGSGLYFTQLQYIKKSLEKNPDEVFIYIPIEFDIVDDGFRSLDKKYQEECDRAIRMAFDDAGITPLVICGPQEKRNKDFLKIIEALEKGKKPSSPNPLKSYKKLEFVVTKKLSKNTDDSDNIPSNNSEPTEFEIKKEEATKFWDKF